MIKSCYCTCGWPVRTNTAITIDCPQCGKLIKCNVPIGLGDRVAWCLALLGGDAYKRLYYRIFGKPCGCAKRQAWLNRMGERLVSSISHCTHPRTKPTQHNHTRPTEQHQQD